MSILENIPNFSNAKILVVGDVMIDKYWFGAADRISPEAPVPVVKIANQEKRLGGAGNVALNFSSIGCNVTLLGLVGNDEGSKFINEQLLVHKINNQLIVDEDISTTTKLRVISKNFQLIRLDFETDKESYQLSKLDELAKSFKLIVNKFDIVVFSDYGKGSLKKIDQLITISKNFNKVTIIDPKQKNGTIYKDASILKPNYKEFELMVGTCKSEDDIDKKAFKLLDNLRLDALVITRGADGISLYQKSREPYKQRATSKEVFDVTGAGDTVIAVLGAFLAKGINLRKTVNFANAAAGIVIGKIGTSYITVEDLKYINQKSDTSLQKILSEREFIEEIKKYRYANKKIVMTNGCFDIIHAGHINYLKEAKKLGDKLVVAVNSDQSIKNLKGEGRPINLFKDRVNVLSAINFVDLIVMFDSDTPEELIKKVKPDILVKGSDYNINQIAGAKYILANGGEVKLIELTKGLSTSNIFNKINDL